MQRILAVLLLLPLSASATAQQPSEDRLKALEVENRQLRDEVQALKQRIQQLEGNGLQPGGTSPAPATTNDPGTNPWGNPDAVRRTLGQALRDDLQARGVTVPDSGADARAMSAYRKEVERWWADSLRTRRFRQAVSWPVELVEASIASNAGTREYDITAYALNDSGARVGRWFVIRCPASAVPNLNPLQATGRWTLRAEVQPEITVVGEGAQAPNVFRQRDLIAPSVECNLRFSVAGLDPTPAPGTAPTTKGKGGH